MAFSISTIKIIQKITSQLEISPEEFQDYVEQSLQKLESLSEILN